MIEEQLIGCFIKDNTLVQDTVIQPKHFQNPIHKIVFTEMKKLSNEGKAIDDATLLERTYHKLDDHHDIDFFVNIQGKGNVNNFDTYEREMIDKHIRLSTKDTLQKHLSDDELDVEKLMTELENIQADREDETGDVHDLYLKLHDEPFNEDTTEEGIETGFTKLTQQLGGFRPGELSIVAARPSMGKTALMLKFMLTAIKNDHVPVVFSLEMTKESLIRRLIAQETGIQTRQTRTPFLLNNSQKEDWRKAVANLNEFPHRIYTQKRTIPEIRTAIRRVKRDFPDKKVVAFVDYLQLLETSERFQSENYKVGYFSKSLKHISLDFEIPVVTLSQLSRGVEQRPEKRPLMSDLRDSGNIEQDADIVMLLYRDAYYHGEDENNRNVLEIHIAKQREGATGMIPVKYKLATGEMEDLNPHDFRRVIDSFKAKQSNRS